MMRPSLTTYVRVPLATDPRSGIPEYLRVLMKPYIDLIIQGKALDHHQGSLKALSMDALDYVNDCFFHPEHCK